MLSVPTCLLVDRSTYPRCLFRDPTILPYPTLPYPRNDLVQTDKGTYIHRYIHTRGIGHESYYLLYLANLPTMSYRGEKSKEKS